MGMSSGCNRRCVHPGQSSRRRGSLGFQCPTYSSPVFRLNTCSMKPRMLPKSCIGIVGVGFLAIPTLAGSVAYAFAETLGWRQGLDKKPKQARAFYTLILLSTGVGVGLDFVGINPVKALYWTAVINGLLAPFLLVAILVVASDKKLMRGQPSSRLGWAVVAITTVAMFAAGVAMFVV